MTADLGSRIVVLSPHLDDAALSLGGAIAGASRSGASVEVVTVFANDPDSTAPPGPWDAVCGFRTAGEAARLRREEDRRACELLGATPRWLPFADVEYEQDVDDDDLWQAVADVVRGTETVLIPGFPLAAPDHLRLTHLLLSRPLPAVQVGLFVEQPYATWRLIGRGRRTGAQGLTPRKGIANLLAFGFRTKAGRRMQMPSSPPELLPGKDAIEWLSLPMGRREWWLKQRAIRAYRSQVEAFGPLVIPRVVVYELGWNGEAIGWVPQR
jgi:LmbE family N-acetylglucosaminyl deacetylase